MTAPRNGRPVPANRNEVLLVGPLAAPAEDRELPSGDVLTSWRLVVRQPQGDPAPVDTLDCATTRPALRRRVTARSAGDVLGQPLSVTIAQEPWATNSVPSLDLPLASGGTQPVRCRRQTVRGSPGRSAASG